DEDASDPQIPLLIWWALESKAIDHREQILQLFAAPAFWQKAIARRFIIGRLARRYAAEDSEDGFAACARLLAQAPGSAETELLMKGIEQALSGRRLEKIPSALEPWFSKVWPRDAPNLALIRLGLRLGSDQALEPAFKLVVDPTKPESDRIALIEILGQINQPRCVPVLLAILEQHGTPKLQTATLAALQRFSEPEVASAILRSYTTLSTEARNRARNVLASRPTWALELVKTVEAGRVDAKDFSFDQLRQMALHKNVELDQLIQKRWGRIQSGSGEEKRSYINELKLVINPSGVAGRPRQGSAPEGKKVFQQVCGVCHTLFGEGNQIGPELTGADRKNLEFMLVHIVNPSAYIRPEYVSYEVVTRDGQAVSGLMVESTPRSATILDRNNQRTVFARDQIKELTESKVSLMPEGLLEALRPEQIIDLFAYLQSDNP
ncbi:MAG: c-type cytochrome, partial [Verrucomicrobiota bacterium]